MEKMFSLILPVYNVADYLDRCIQSVLAQSGDDYEVILVDDGSKDRSGRMCDQWAEKDARIRVIHKPNGGLSSARNAGLEIAVGQYAVMIDSDDFVETSMLDVLREAIRESSADIIHFSYVTHSPNRTVEERCRCRTGLYSGTEITKQLLERVLLEPSFYKLSAWTHAYSTAFLKRNQLQFVSERIVLSEDYLFNLCALQCASSLFVTDHALYHYDDMRAGSLTQSAKPRMFERYTELYQEARSFFEEHHASQDLLEKLNCYYVYFLFYCNTVSYEYNDSPEHPWRTARLNVKKMLTSRTLHESACRLDETGLPLKERLKIAFIRFRFEPGLAFAFRKRKKG